MQSFWDGLESMAIMMGGIWGVLEGTTNGGRVWLIAIWCAASLAASALWDAIFRILTGA